MNKSTKTLLAYAALAGICSSPLISSSRAARAVDAGRPQVVAAESDKASCAGKEGCGAKDKQSCKGIHDCKGQNGCKGQGGCQSSDNGCKGKNSCKGKGGCSTAKRPSSEHKG